jgi:hypothetical protein
LKKRQDLSGPAVVKVLEAAGFKIIHTSILPDEKDAIAARLIECSEVARLVVTIGGTGIALRDVTPEATRTVVEQMIRNPGKNAARRGEEDSFGCTQSWHLRGSRPIASVESSWEPGGRCRLARVGAGNPAARLRAFARQHRALGIAGIARDRRHRRRRKIKTVSKEI